MSQPTLPTSPGLHAVLTGPPAWAERWGTLLVASLLGALLAAAGLVRYADVVTVTFTGLTVRPASNEVVVWTDLPAALAGTVRPGQPVQLVPAGTAPGASANPVAGQVVALAAGTVAGHYQLTIRLPSQGNLPTQHQRAGTLRLTAPATSLLSRMWQPRSPASSSPH